MKIRLYLITSTAEYDALPQRWQEANCQTNACRKVVQAADVLEGEGIYPDFPQDIRVIAYAWQVFNTEYPDVARKLGLSGPPAVLFYDEDERMVIATLSGTAVSTNRIVELYRRLAQFVPGEQEGVRGYFTDGGKFTPLSQILEATSGSGFGLGLFNGMLGGAQLPSWLWLLAALAAGYKTVTVKKGDENMRLVWGGLAGISVYNYLKQNKNTTPPA
ncbi:MAG: hypothetical protein ACKV1O_31055 [Saprospiraceae bacterium]